MGAIQGAINQMITSSAIGLGAATKIKADAKEAQVKANALGQEAIEKEAEGEAIKAAQQKYPGKGLNVPTVAQFIQGAQKASLAANQSYQNMLRTAQQMADHRKRLLDLI